MIRYFDQIATNPTAEDVNGKFVLATGIFEYRTFRKPGRVTRISGNRVYIEPIHMEDDSKYFIDETAKSLPSNREQKNFITLNSIGAVCDTLEEVQSIASASKKSLKCYQAHVRAMKLEINGFFNDLNEPEETTE